MGDHRKIGWLFAAVLSPVLAYPAASSGIDSTTFFGKTVADPYRWMESVDSPQTRAWSSAENTLTRSYLDGLPLRDSLRQRLERLWQYHTEPAARTYGALRVRRETIGLPTRAVFVARFGKAGRDRIVLDSAERRDDGAIALDSATFSGDGRYLAFATSRAASATVVWHVRDLRTLATLNDRVVADASASAVWTADDRGFFYETVVQGSKHIVIREMYHELGKRRTLDRRSFAFRTVPNSTMTAAVTSDGRWLVVTTYPYGAQLSPRVYIRRASSDGGPMRELFAGRPANQGLIDSLSGALLFQRSDAACPDSCIVAVDPGRPTRVQILVPDTGNDIDAATVVGDRLFVLYSVDAHSSIVEDSATGRTLRTLQLPAIGTVDPNAFRDDGSGRRLSVTFYNYTIPPTVLLFDISSGERTVSARTTVHYDPASFVTEQRFFSSADGTRVPMFVTHLRSLSLDGANPTILYVYGGFGESQLPVWTPEIVSWLSVGGIYAVVNARGGGEYGEAWHRAGIVLQKQHSIDDVIAAANELARDGYADSEHLALRGDSNGGLVAADAALQQPHSFKALVTREGLLDLVRYDRMSHGDWWAAEFGSKSASAAQFANIVRLSPVAAARPGISYPAALIQTGDEDAIVSPAHAFKFVATLQADQAGPNPILLRVDHGVGHGGGESLSKVIDESVDQYSFLLHLMGVNRLAPLRDVASTSRP